MKILFVTKRVAGTMRGKFNYSGEWTDTYELIMALKKISPSLEIFLLTPYVVSENLERFNEEFGDNLRENNIKHYFAKTYLDHNLPLVVFRWSIFRKELELVRKHKIDIIQYGQLGLNYSYFFKKFMRVSKIIVYGCFDDVKNWPGKNEDDANKKDTYFKGSFFHESAIKLKKIVLAILLRIIRIRVFDNRVDYFAMMHPRGYELLRQNRELKSNLVYIPKGQSNALNIVINNKKKTLKRVLFMGVLQQRKGIMDFIKVATEFPALTFNIVGGGNIDIERKIENKSKSCRNIVFMGPVNYDKKWNIYRENDLFLLPSFKDSFPSVILEALSCGLPVITTYEIDSPVINGKNGYLFHAGDIGELKEAISRLADRPDEYRRLSANALNTAQEYTWAKAAKEFLKIYSKS